MVMSKGREVRCAAVLSEEVFERKVIEGIKQVGSSVEGGTLGRRRGGLGVKLS